MLGILLRRDSQLVELLPGHIFRNAYHLRDLRCPVSQGSRLVKSQCPHGSKPFQSIPLPYQKTVLRRVSDGRHHGRRCRQNQPAGTEYHENRYRPDDLSGNQPGQCRSHQSDNHNPGGPAVRQPNNLCLSRVRRLYQADHALDRTVLSHLFRPHLKGAELIDGAAGHRVSHSLIHRQGLPSHNRLVDRCLTADDHAVHRDTLPWQHPKQIPHAHLLRGNDLLPVRSLSSGRPRRQMHQLLDAGPRLRHRQFLQKPANLHDKGHLPGGKILPDTDGCDQRHGYQYVRLYVKGGNQPDESLQHNGYTAEQNRRPGRVKWQRKQIKKAADQGNPGYDKKDNILFCSPELQQIFQFLHQFFYYLFHDPFRHPFHRLYLRCFCHHSFFFQYTYRGMGLSRRYVI